MAEVTVTINGRDYRVACADGQEDRLSRLAGYVDKKITDLTKGGGRIDEARLLVMASLLVADELADAHEALAATRAHLEGDGSGEGTSRPWLGSVASRLEALAEALEKS